MFLTGDGHDDDFEGILEKLSVRLVVTGMARSRRCVSYSSGAGGKKKKEAVIGCNVSKQGQQETSYNKLHVNIGVILVFFFSTITFSESRLIFNTTQAFTDLSVQCPRPSSALKHLKPWRHYMELSRLKSEISRLGPKSGSIFWPKTILRIFVLCIGWLWNRDGIKMYCTKTYIIFLYFMYIYIYSYVRFSLSSRNHQTLDDENARFLGAPKLVPRSRSTPGFKRSSRPLVAGGVALCQETIVFGTHGIFSTWKMHWKLNLTCNLMVN